MKAKSVVFIVLALILLSNTVAIFCISNNILTVSQVETIVEKVVEPETKLQEMLNAKIDCERLIPRTQECVLVYDYVPVGE